MAANSQDVGITYSSNSTKKENKERKCTSLGNDPGKENDVMLKTSELPKECDEDEKD